LRDAWPAGETGATEVFRQFRENGLNGYAQGRDFPAKTHVSRLSPYLRFGMISPYQAWHGVEGADAPFGDIEKFRKELAWREFSWHLLFHRPDLAERNFSERFDVFPWQDNPQHLRAWQKGATGYPMVDAGMRQLWTSGTMHNRVRMIAASFLVKHLLIDWRQGEKWFWDTLVDGDPANNPASWQWVAGCGADAAPYFRVFNPILQGEKFDATGGYVRRWLPEIARLPDRYLHAPWKAPASALNEAGIRLGDSYPLPIVDHDFARARALEAFKSLKKVA
jgi:deoxyribodipyrimidine photo-lyase